MISNTHFVQDRTWCGQRQHRSHAHIAQISGNSISFQTNLIRDIFLGRILAAATLNKPELFHVEQFRLSHSVVKPHAP